MMTNPNPDQGLKRFIGKLRPSVGYRYWHNTADNCVYYLDTSGQWVRGWHTAYEKIDPAIWKPVADAVEKDPWWNTKWVVDPYKNSTWWTHGVTIPSKPPYEKQAEKNESCSGCLGSGVEMDDSYSKFPCTVCSSNQKDSNAD
jgi:hypothetical protein